MGAERWIVFLVLASLGGAIYIMSYMVEEDSYERFGKRIAEYNADHGENMLDAALHRSKRRPVVSDHRVDAKGGNAGMKDAGMLSENGRVVVSTDGELKSGRAELSSDHDINKDSDHENPQGDGMADHPLSEIDRLMRARMRDGENLASGRDKLSVGMEEETPSSRKYNGQDIPRARRSSKQGIVKGGPDHPLLEQFIVQGSQTELPSEDKTGVSDGFGAVWKLEQSSDESLELSDDSNGDEKLVTFNKGMDFILNLMNSMFSLEGEISVPLPAMNKTFGHGVMQGRLQASEGFFKNPATLHRTGDVAIVKNGDTVGLEVAVGLTTLAAGYNRYDLDILKIHQNGTLDVSVAENSIKMKISLTYSPRCKVNVNYLELDKLGGIKINITGLGAFQSMFDMISKWLLDNFTNDFRNIVNKKLIEKAKKAVDRQDICKHFPLNSL